MMYWVLHYTYTYSIVRCGRSFRILSAIFFCFSSLPFFPVRVLFPTVDPVHSYLFFLKVSDWYIKWKDCGLCWITYYIQHDAFFVMFLFTSLMFPTAEVMFLVLSYLTIFFLKSHILSYYFKSKIVICN